MAKKKSDRFIIPASYFASVIVEEKLDVLNKGISTSSPPGVLQEERKEYTSKGKVGTTKINNIRLNDFEIVKPDTQNIDKTRRKSALSLSSLKRDKLEEEKLKSLKKTVENLEDMPKDPFTEETFLKIWNAYIQDLHIKGEKIFASILKTDTPKIKNNTIFVTYPNRMMKAELLKVKPKALRYLRQELNNYSIDFDITVNEETAKKFAYTPQEKYELLKEKNEAIALLKKTFNLEL
jgi:DNA polymerase-3 subunit gamma/tau